jgi:hypothetical protein
MVSIFERLRRNKSGEKLRDREIRELQVVAKVDRLDFRKLKFEDAISQIEGKLRRNNQQSFSMVIGLGALLSLLFFSLIGVQLEITLLGVKLTQIENAKEVIVIFSICGSLFTRRLDDNDEYLRSLRRAI